MASLANIYTLLHGFQASAVDALPAAPVEPSDIRLIPSTTNVVMCSVCAPQAVPASLLVVHSVASAAPPGRRLLLFSLDFSAGVPEGALPEDAAVIAASLAAHVRALAHTAAPGDGVSPAAQSMAPLSQLLVTASPRSTVPTSARLPQSSCIVDVWTHAPSGLPRGAAVVIQSVSIAGQPLPAAEAARLLHCSIPVGGLRPGLVLTDPRGLVSNWITQPAITPEGTLLVPKRSSDVVFIFGCDGEPLPPLAPADLGLNENTRAAAVCPEAGLLLLANSADPDDDCAAPADPAVVAVDLMTRTVRWTVLNPGMLFKKCLGLAVLHAQGVFFAGSYHSNRVYALRLGDGSSISSVEVESPLQVRVAVCVP
jgi:hypothetical protein